MTKQQNVQAKPQCFPISKMGGPEKHMVWGVGSKSLVISCFCISFGQRRSGQVLAILRRQQEAPGLDFTSLTVPEVPGILASEGGGGNAWESVAVPPGAEERPINAYWILMLGRISRMLRFSFHHEPNLPKQHAPPTPCESHALRWQNRCPEGRRRGWWKNCWVSKLQYSGFWLSCCIGLLLQYLRQFYNLLTWWSKRGLQIPSSSSSWTWCWRKTRSQSPGASWIESQYPEFLVDGWSGVRVVWGPALWL